MGRKGMHIGFWWESQKERDNYEDLDVGAWIILKWILENCSMDVIDLANDRNQWRAVVDTGKFLRCCTSGGFSRTSRVCVWLNTH
jgi:hypothetical protein